MHHVVVVVVVVAEEEEALMAIRVIWQLGCSFWNRRTSSSQTSFLSNSRGRIEHRMRIDDRLGLA